MKNELQIKRIEEFIDSLDHSELMDGQQAIVLQSELSVIGGRNGSCNNGGQAACLDSNGTCTNSSGCGSKNSKCNNGGEAGKPGAQ